MAWKHGASKVQYSDEYYASQRAAQGSGYPQAMDKWRARHYPDLLRWRYANARMLHDLGYHLKNDKVFRDQCEHLGVQ